MNYRIPFSSAVLFVLTWLATVPQAAVAAAEPAGRPNIVIVVADDMGWRDTGYRGHPVVKTPHLDDLASKGVQFEYFYPGQQMCAPGRFAIMSGRNPCRTGLHHLGATRSEELFLPRVLKQAGYQSAHFGKWHLGAGKSSPVGMGFDQARWTPNYFDLNTRFQIDDTQTFVETKGESSIAVMNLALDYIRKQGKAAAPFFVQVCFGSPHSPHRAAEEFKALYKDQPQRADFLGELSGLDAAVGNLRAELRQLGIAENTLLWFVSDNGGITPQSMDPSGKGKQSVGCRTQGLLEWPARVKQQLKTNVVAGHIDIYPTLLELTGVKVDRQPVLDGVSLVPLLEGKMTERPRPIGFLLWNGKGGFDKADFVKDVQGVWIDGKYKLVVNPDSKGVALYDIFADPTHKTNLADQEPERVQKMRQALDVWRGSVRASFDGKDFGKP